MIASKSRLQRRPDNPVYHVSLPNIQIGGIQEIPLAILIKSSKS
jgi:hypothetical protein